MNDNRECYLVVCMLPYEVKMRFGKSGAPAEKDLKPVFRRLGSNKCLSNRLEVVSRTDKEVCVRLPDTLAYLGPGRYELLLHDKCCRECDSVEIWFEADCEVIEVSGEEVDENCDEC